MDKLQITREGLEKLKAELAACFVRRREVAATIEHARSFGDLKENAEYHAAKEEQGILHARIRDYEHKIATAEIIDDQDIDPTKAFLGATVTVMNKRTKAQMTYTLVGPVEADVESNKISVRSPVGQALLGKSVGDVVTAKVPAGDLQLEIKNISR